MRDSEKVGFCRPVLFEARDYCQIASRTWSPMPDPTRLPLRLNDLTRDPSPAMKIATDAVLRLSAPRNWAPRLPAQDTARPLPGSDRWFSQLEPKHRNRKQDRDTQT